MSYQVPYYNTFTLVTAKKSAVIFIFKTAYGKTEQSLDRSCLCSRAFKKMSEGGVTPKDSSVFGTERDGSFYMIVKRYRNIRADKRGIVLAYSR